MFVAFEYGIGLVLMMLIYLYLFVILILGGGGDFLDVDWWLYPITAAWS